jgi:carbon-monoxide dehydrogenase medium subunit
MYPTGFAYAAPGSVEAALERLATAAAAGRDARVLAGGHSLLPELKQGASAPDLLVDVGGIDALRGVTVDDEEGTVAVGATTSYADAGRAEPVAVALAPLADALAAVGDRQVRNRGTVGGNLAQADPGTDLPAPVLALDGRLVVRGPDGERTTPLAAFYEAGGPGPAELVTRVELPALGPDAAGAYLRRAHPHTGYPVVGVAAVLEFDGPTVTDARVAATGATSRRPAVRLRAVERAVVGTRSDPDPGEAIAVAATRAAEEAVTDGFADDAVSPAYRAHLLEVYTERTLWRAVERRAGGASTGG